MELLKDGGYTTEEEWSKTNRNNVRLSLESDDDDDDEYNNEVEENEEEYDNVIIEKTDNSDDSQIEGRLVVRRRNDVDNLSETTETEIMSSLSEQNDYYSASEKEKFSKDFEKMMQTYLKKIYRQLKWMSDVSKEYKEPNFIVHVHGIKSQTVEVCEYLWRSLGK